MVTGGLVLLLFGGDVLVKGAGYARRSQVVGADFVELRSGAQGEGVLVALDSLAAVVPVGTVDSALSPQPTTQSVSPRTSCHFSVWIRIAGLSWWVWVPFLGPGPGGPTA